MLLYDKSANMRNFEKFGGFPEKTLEFFRECEYNIKHKSF